MQINPVFPDYTRNLMKKTMNTKWKLLTLAALLSAGTTTANAADPGYGGDFGEDAYFAASSDYVGGLYEEDSTAASGMDNEISTGDYLDDLEPAPGALEPVAFVSDSQPAAQQQNAVPQNYQRHVGSGRTMSATPYGCQSGNCGGNCGSVACRPARRRVASQTNAWMTAEALLWFPQVRSTVPLVSQGPTGTLPELDRDGVSTAFGGTDQFGGELQAGFRVDGGIMLNEDFGVGGRFWMLGETEDTFSASGDGTNGSIGIPFFDSALSADQENSIKIAYSDGDSAGTTDFQGSVSARSALSVYGAEGYGRLRLLGGKGYRSDLIGGFSHFGIDEEMSLNARTTQTETGPGQGDEYRFIEDLDAENRFYGGQIGFLTSVGRGAWSLTALTKVHLGNMDQTWTDRGSRQFVGQAAQPGGLFGNTPEQQYSSSNFAFAPEANVKLAYKLRENIKFSVGYSFIMWDDVLMIGDNLNRSINTDYLVPDSTGAVDPAERPLFTGLKTDSFFVHGIDLGCVIQF